MAITIVERTVSESVDLPVELSPLLRRIYTARG